MDTGNIGTPAQRSAALDLLMAGGLDYLSAARILAEAIRRAQRESAELVAAEALERAAAARQLQRDLDAAELVASRREGW